MCQAHTCGRRRAEVGQRARAAVFPQSFANNEVSADLVQNRLSLKRSVQNSGLNLLLKFLSIVNVSLFRQNLRFQSYCIFQSYYHLQSIWAELGGLGDGQKLRTRTRVLMVRKAIPSNFPDFLELKQFLCRITVGPKKIGQCWKSAAADLWNGRWMGSASDSGLESLRIKARGTNYVVLN